MKRFYPALLLVFAMTSAMQAATFTSASASGVWSNPLHWTVSGSDADGIPDSDDDVIIAAGTFMDVDIQITDFRSMNVNPGGTLDVAGRQLRIRGGSFTQDGNMPGTCTLYFFGPGGTISGNFNNSGNWYFYINSNYTIAASCVVNKTTNYIYLLNNAIVNNFGTVRLNSGTISFGPTALWRNRANSSLRVTRNFTGNPNLEAHETGNTVEFFGSQSTLIDNLPLGYFNLSLRNNPKTLEAGTTFLVAGNLTLSTMTSCNANNNSIVLGGNWDNQANVNVTNLPLITFNSTDAQSIRRTTLAELFNDVIIDSQDSLNLLSDVRVNGTTTLNSGLLNPGNFNYRQRGANWNGEGGSVSMNGRIIFDGTVAQTIGGSFFTNFGNLEINNTAGVNNAANNRIRGTLFLTAGTFSASSNDFMFVSDASGTARVDELLVGGGNVNGNRFICQRFIGVSAPSTTTPYWSYFSSPVLASTVLDWDNEMYMSGVGGADGNACCPIFRSVRRYSGSVFTNVTSVSTALGITQGFQVWTADNMTSFTGLLFDTRGTLTTGNRTATVPTGFTLIGNPYMSQIQWSSLTRTNVNNFFYILDESISNYATWNGATNTGTAKLAASGGVINSSQGFLVQATAAGSVGFTESAKTSGTATFVRQAADNALLRLQLRRTDGQPIGAENVITFDAAAADGQDETDIPALLAPNENAPYMRTLTGSGNELFFDNRSISAASHSVPVNITPGMAGDFQLKFGNIDQFNAYSCVFLEDLQTGRMLNVRRNETITLHAGNGVDELRYVLHFDQEEPATAGFSYCRFEDLNASAASATIPVTAIGTPDGMLLNFGFAETTPVIVTVYNLLGQEILREQYNVSSEQVKLPLLNDARGVYILRVQAGENEVSQKISY
ncbi:MAG: T9SS type A sorting domain-containing protein [Bacteroidetes bacterium]|nr:T9SS type A sorting domain-containing protein [Bacteroidota bacterium]